MSHALLADLWFGVVGFFWLGYFVLEGFDFGVGMLLPILGREGPQRQAMLRTIEPVWDGNEVWLIVAVGATFAAFPAWYATLFSGFYAAIFLVLVALILRAVAFEFRGKVEDPRWVRWWERAITVGSLLPALIWGLVLAGQLGGIPIDRAGDFTGGPMDLLRPYALVGALAFAVLFFLYGSVFLCLRTTGPLTEHARQLTGRVWLVALVVVGGFLAWTFAGTSGGRGHGALSIALPAVSFIALALVLILHRARREALAFAATGIAILCLVSTLFLALFPRVLVSSVSESFSLTVAGASSSPYALGVMSVGAVIFAPVVLVYEGWAYWVFRKRVASAPMDTRAAGSRGA